MRPQITGPGSAAVPGSPRRIAGLGPVAFGIVAAILPVFLLGSLSIEIRGELGYGEATGGLILAVFFAASAVVSSRIGRGIDRIGPRHGLLAALSGIVVLQLLIAGAGRHPWVLAVLAGASGICNATAQLSANVFIARDLPMHRQGVGFAVKQSAMPGASLVAGLTLPAIALTLGWRWVFVLGAALAAGAMTLVALRLPEETPAPARCTTTHGTTTHGTTTHGTTTAGTTTAGTVGGDTGEDVGGESAPGDNETAPPGDDTAPPRGALAALAVAAAFSTAAAITLGGFFVESAIDAGITAATAGLAFAGGSLVSIVVRLTVGVIADRRPGNQLGAVAVMIALGALASVWFTWRSPTMQLIGVPLAFGAGWAWPGLFNLSVVRASPGFPGRATGITQTGTYIGAAVGPVLFGAVAQSAGFGAAWWLAAGLGLAASAAVLVGRAVLMRAPARGNTTTSH